MAEQGSSAWPGLLPAKVVKEWAEIHHDAPMILLNEIASDARHMRRIAWVRLGAACVLWAGSMVLSVFLVQAASPTGGAISTGGGTLTVATILLTGRRPPSLRRR